MKVDIVILASAALCLLFAWNSLKNAIMFNQWILFKEEVRKCVLALIWWTFWAIVFLIWWLVR